MIVLRALWVLKVLARALAASLGGCWSTSPGGLRNDGRQRPFQVGQSTAE